MNNINGMLARYSNVKKQQTYYTVKNYYENKKIIIFKYDVFYPFQRHIQ